MFIKFIIAFILVMLLAYTAYLFSSVIPWWGFAPAVFLVGLAIPQKAWLSWLSGFAGLFCCWAFLTYNISSKNGHLLASKMALVLPLGGSSAVLITIAALAGAIVGGFATLTGAYLRKREF